MYKIFLISMMLMFSLTGCVVLQFVLPETHKIFYSSKVALTKEDIGDKDRIQDSDNFKIIDLSKEYNTLADIVILKESAFYRLSELWFDGKSRISLSYYDKIGYLCISYDFGYSSQTKLYKIELINPSQLKIVLESGAMS